MLDLLEEKRKRLIIVDFYLSQCELIVSIIRLNTICLYDIVILLMSQYSFEPHSGLSHSNKQSACQEEVLARLDPGEHQKSEPDG